MSQADRERIIRKIKKCLRLAASTNEHEAAVALSQARSLMAEYQLTEDEVLASGASESRARAGAREKPSSWEANLANTIARAFGCDLLFSGGIGHWCFIGCGAAAEVAQYAFVVTVRQARKARAEYIAKVLRRCGPSSKTTRADLYCTGWVVGVQSKVQFLAGTEAEQKAIEAYISRISCETITPRSRTAGKSLSLRQQDDFYRGYARGREVELRRPVGAEAKRALTAGGE